jgi:signal transduction histidine kinase
MKTPQKSLTTRLSLSFLLIVLITVLSAGILFIAIFSRYTLASGETSLKARARTIAMSVSLYMEPPYRVSQFAEFIELLDSITDARIWILDAQGNIIAISSMDCCLYTPTVLPPLLEGLAESARSGEEVVERHVSEVYGEEVLTAAVPVFGKSGAVLGSVMLHTPMTGMANTLTQAFQILFLILAASMLLAVAAGVLFARRLTSPLKKLSQTAFRIADGDYNVSLPVNSSVRTQDEIGQLAGSLEQLANRLDENQKQAAQLEQVRKDFVANVSHEFRTPLTIIRGAAEAIRDGVVTDAAQSRHFLDRVLVEVNGLEHLVRDLLDLGLLQSGKLKLDFSPIRLTDVAAEAVRALQTVAEKKNVPLLIVPAPDLPMINGNADRLRQLFVIFLDNAIRYSSPGHPVTITFGRNAHASGEHVVCRIRDEGRGISPEDLPFIWDRFYKTDKSRKPGDPGTGLGLAIASWIIDLHRGTRQVFSEPGTGTIFEIGFPVLRT